MRSYIKGIIKKSSVLQFVHANVRGTLQDRRAARSLAQHKLLVAHEAYSSNLGLVESNLRSRIRNRKPNLVPKQLGEMHIFVAFQVWDWEAVGFHPTIFTETDLTKI
jgi:hypothetical protein